ERIVERHRKFNGDRRERLEARKVRQAKIADGKDLDFLPETAEIRNDPSWQVAPPAPGLEDRRVEVTGPTYKKMTINALNSGAKVWLADQRSEEHTSELQSRVDLVCRLLLEKKKYAVE